MTERKLSKYSVEFKERAMALADEIGSNRASQVLGIHVNTLRMMLECKQLKLKNLSPKSPEERVAIETARELNKLRKENEELKKANLILRELASDFSRGPLPTSLGWSKKSSKGQK